MLSWPTNNSSLRLQCNYQQGHPRHNQSCTCTQLSSMHSTHEMLEDEIITTVGGLQHLLLALSLDTASKSKRRSWGYGRSSEQHASRVSSAAAAATLLQQETPRASFARGVSLIKRLYQPSRIVCVWLQNVALSLHMASQLAPGECLRQSASADPQGRCPHQPRRHAGRARAPLPRPLQTMPSPRLRRCCAFCEGASASCALTCRGTPARQRLRPKAGFWPQPRGRCGTCTSSRCWWRATSLPS